MDVIIIGLGKMGAGVAQRLIKAGHSVTVYNRTPEKAQPLVEMGARQIFSIEEVGSHIQAPRVVWVYLPAGEVTDSILRQLTTVLQPGDIVLDGGNSEFTHTLQNQARFAERQIHFLDVGTSGGVAGRTEGYCLMVGGDTTAFEQVKLIFEAVAQPDGYQLVGPAGAGHYVKMVHNAIEYGMMQAYGEGLEVLHDGSFAGKLNLAQITKVWQKGSIIRSYLGELLQSALEEEPNLTSVAAVVEDNGEGRWTIEEALRCKIPVPVITSALFERFSSRRQNAFSYKVISVLRKKFGGHPIKTLND